MTKLREDLPRLLVEACMIVFSVLLALGFNTWWQERQNQQLAEETVIGFTAEICTNLRSVERVAPYHEDVGRELADYLSRLEEPPPDESFFQVLMQSAPEGLEPPDLRDTAWQAALASGAMRYLDSKTVHRLARVYATQESGASSTWPQMLRSVMRPEAFQPAWKPHVVEFLRLSFHELASQEKYLAEVYREALDALDGDCG